jgi:hypothetical protein
MRTLARVGHMLRRRTARRWVAICAPAAGPGARRARRPGSTSPDLVVDGPRRRGWAAGGWLAPWPPGEVLGTTSGTGPAPLVAARAAMSPRHVRTPAPIATAPAATPVMLSSGRRRRAVEVSGSVVGRPGPRSLDVAAGPPRTLAARRRREVPTTSAALIGTAMSPATRGTDRVRLPLIALATFGVEGAAGLVALALASLASTPSLTTLVVVLRSGLLRHRRPVR